MTMPYLTPSQRSSTAPSSILQLFHKALDTTLPVFCVTPVPKMRDTGAKVLWSTKRLLTQEILGWIVMNWTTQNFQSFKLREGTTRTLSFICNTSLVSKCWRETVILSSSNLFGMKYLSSTREAKSSPPLQHCLAKSSTYSLCLYTSRLNMSCLKGSSGWSQGSGSTYLIQHYINICGVFWQLICYPCRSHTSAVLLL